MAIKKNFLKQIIPKRVLKVRSRCRRKLYRLIGTVENILLGSDYKNSKLNNRKRADIRASVYLYLAEKLYVSVKRLQFRTMSNRQCIRLERLLDETKPIQVIEWVKANSDNDKINKEKNIIINGE